MAFWDNIGRALSKIGDFFSGGEGPPEPVRYQNLPGYEEPQPEYEQSGLGDFFDTSPTGEEFPDQKSLEDLPEDEPFIYEFGQGPYPDDWGQHERDFWDEVADGLSFEDRQNYEDALEDFEGGYMTPGLSQEAREAYRQNFSFDMDQPIFEDWEAFREYWEEVSPPA